MTVCGPHYLYYVCLALREPWHIGRHEQMHLPLMHGDGRANMISDRSIGDIHDIDDHSKNAVLEEKRLRTCVLASNVASNVVLQACGR